MSYVIHASTNIQDLVGIGSEILTDDEGNIRIEFFDGKAVRCAKGGNLEDTLIIKD